MKYLKRDLISKGAVALTLVLLAAVPGIAQTKVLPKKNKASQSSSSDQAMANEVEVSPSKSARPLDEQPVLQFNTLSTPASTSDRETFKFKTPGDGSPTSDVMANPVENQKNEAVFKTYLGYPKHFVNLTYAPVSYGAKYSYSGAEYNFSSTDVQGLEVSYSLQATPSVFFEVEGNTYTAKSKSGSASPYNVSESKATLFSIMFRGNYCWVGSNFYARICPGAELGTDTYPSLGFKAISTLEMQTASEMMYGANVYAQYPLIYSTNISARLGYVMGSGTGQSGSLTSKKNQLTYLDSKLEWPVGGAGHLMNLGVYYGMRSATVEGKVSSTITDKWDTNSGLLIFKVGYSWEL